MIKTEKNMVDVSGAELHIGDKVATWTKQLFRIGVVTGFTGKKVIVGFAYSALTPDEVSEESKLSPFNLAIVRNQDAGLSDYYKYHTV